MPGPVAGESLPTSPLPRPVSSNRCLWVPVYLEESVNRSTMSVCWNIFWKEGKTNTFTYLEGLWNRPRSMHFEYSQPTVMVNSYCNAISCEKPATVTAITVLVSIRQWVDFRYFNCSQTIKLLCAITTTAIFFYLYRLVLVPWYKITSLPSHQKNQPLVLALGWTSDWT